MDFARQDGSPIPLTNRTIIIGGNLTIDRIQEQDRGLYQCAVSNEAATVVAVQLERQQQQQRCHVDLGAGIRETQDGILGLVISINI